MPAAVDGVITITTAEQLAAVAAAVNGGINYSGVTIKLGVDIDLNNREWTPISTDFYNPFAGTFDGDGHTISNLKINSDKSGVGLFGIIDGTIMNVTLNNVDVTGWDHVGGLVSLNVGSVENCTVTNATVSGAEYVGGLVGENYKGTVKDNSFYSNKGDVGANDDGTVSGNTKLYKLTLPSGVEATATGTGNKVVADNGNYYAAGTVTLKASAANAIIRSTNYTNNDDGTVSVTPTADTSISSSDIAFYYAVSIPNCVQSVSGTSYGGNYSDYYTGTVTLAAKTGYNLSQTSLTVTKAETITASFDTTNHYVLADNTSTLATADNTTDYPDLIQVYALNLPEGVSVSGDTVVTVDGTTYATGKVTLSATDTSKILQNITVNGASDDDGAFTVTADTKVTADIVSGLVFGNGGKSVVVVGTTGDLSSFSSVYSITASKENSTLVGNGKNNTVVLTGGGENILTGGGGNDTFKFESGGGIVTDYGIGATKSGDGKTLSAAPGSDVVKVSGNVTGIYFDRNSSSKKSAKFTAVVTYGSGDDTQIIVLQNINKKPTKYGSNPVYQTNDTAAATLKIWDTSGSKQAVLSASKLKKLFHDDSDLSELSQTVQTQLVKLNSIGDLNLPAVDQLNQTAQATFNGGDNG